MSTFHLPEALETALNADGLCHKGRKHKPWSVRKEIKGPAYCVSLDVRGYVSFSDFELMARFGVLRTSFVSAGQLCFFLEPQTGGAA